MGALGGDTLTAPRRSPVDPEMLEAVREESERSPGRACRSTLEALARAPAPTPTARSSTSDPVEALARRSPRSTAARSIILTRPHVVSEFFHRRLDLARPPQDRRPGAPPARARELRRAGRQRRGRHGLVTRSRLRRPGAPRRAARPPTASTMTYRITLVAGSLAPRPASTDGTDPRRPADPGARPPAGRAGSVVLEVDQSPAAAQLQRPRAPGARRRRPPPGYADCSTAGRGRRRRDRFLRALTAETLMTAAGIFFTHVRSPRVRRHFRRLVAESGTAGHVALRLQPRRRARVPRRRSPTTTRRT